MASESSRPQESWAELRRSLSGEASEIAQVLHDLAKTTRSFGFYARDNRAIARFVAALTEGFARLLDAHGVLRLDVGADRFVWEGQAVYLDADRERGLPFRLFRDGVRKVVFKRGLESAELLTLLDVLSRRQSTGRSAEEEDVVTLLWKLSLNHISYEAVEGFTHDLHGDAGEGGGEALPRIMGRIADPDPLVAASASGLSGTASSLYGGHAHYLLPPPPEGRIAWSPLTREELRAVRAELDHEQWVGVPQLIAYWFELASQESAFFGLREVAPMLGAIRRHLLRSRDLATYDRALRALLRARDGGGRLDLRAGADELLASCASPEALAALVAASTGDARAEDFAHDVLRLLGAHVQPEDLFELLCQGLSEHMAGVLAAVAVDRSGLETALYARGLALGEGEPQATRAMAALRCLGTLGTAEAAEQMGEALLWPIPEVRRAALRILGRIPLAPSAPATFARALRDADRAVWREALAAIWAQQRRELAPGLAQWLGEVGFSWLDEGLRREVAAMLADLDPDYATAWFSERLQMGMRARMGGLVGTPERIAWNHLAAFGLAEAATPEAVERLREVRTQGDQEFREHTTRLLVRARHKAGAR